MSKSEEKLAWMLEVPEALACGLNPEQIENLLCMSIATTGGIDTQYMLREKKRMIKSEEKSDKQKKLEYRISITEKMDLMAGIIESYPGEGKIPSAMIIRRSRKGYPAPSFSMEKVQQFRDDLASALKKQEEE